MPGAYRHKKSLTIIKDSKAQLSALQLQGLISLNDSTRNVDDDGELHVSISQSGSTVTVDIYKDVDRASADKVATGSRSGDGAITLTAANSSGVTGKVTVAYDSDKSDIKVRAFYTLDEDLTLYEKEMGEWLPTGGGFPDATIGPVTAGFAVAHAEAKFETEKRLRELRSAHLPAIDTDIGSLIFREQPFDPGFFGLVGDLTQRVPDWQFLVNRDQLTQVTAYYALYLIAWHEKNRNPDQGGQWADLALWYRERWEKECVVVDLDFDLDQDGSIDEVSEVSDNRIERG